MTPDLINGLFEGSAAFFILPSIRKLEQDKEVKGVHWIQIAFFTIWTAWNLYFYPEIDQDLSFYGALAAFSANAVYAAQIVRYYR